MGFNYCMKIKKGRKPKDATRYKIRKGMYVEYIKWFNLHQLLLRILRINAFLNFDFVIK